MELVVDARKAHRRRAALLVLLLLLWPAGSHAQTVVDFWSDASWSTADAAGQPVGPAMLVCLNASVAGSCPAGATSWDWPLADAYRQFVEIPNARWIWGPGNTPASPSHLALYTFTRTFDLPGTPLTGVVQMTADDRVELRVNGVLAGVVGSVQTGQAWPLAAFDILPLLVPGRNTIAFTAQNGPTSFGLGQDSYSNNPAGVVFGGRITVGAAGVPGPPTGFSVAASGSDVRLAWGPPVSGGAPTGYTLLARLVPGGPVVGSLALGNVVSFNLTGPDGVFYVSLQGTNASGAGAESAQVAVALPAAVQPPNAPVGLTATVTGTTVVISWLPPPAGSIPAAYLVEAGVVPWFTRAIGTATLPGPARSLVVTDVPDGVYYVRVAGRNAGGSSPPSAELTVVVGAAAVPGTPAFEYVQVVGRTVTVGWLPAAGLPATHYLLAASTSPDGPLSAPVMVTGTSLVVPSVPPGTYYLHVRAATAAGASTPSPPFLVVVP